MFASGCRWCLAVLSPWPGGCCSGRVRARLRRVFCLRAGACFFSFRGFRLVTSPRCGGGFFAMFASGFRWCLAVLNPSPGGCCSGCLRARLRRVFCLRAGTCFFSFRGFRLVTSPRCGGGFFAMFASGFRWCLAVLSPLPDGPTEGSAAWAVALKSGRRPMAAGPCPCRRPSVGKSKVIEASRPSRRPQGGDLGLTSGSPEPL